MANITTSLKNWSSTAASNQPDSTDSATLVGDLQAIQAAVRAVYSQDTIASSGTTDIGSKDAGSLTISGTTTITALGTVSAGIVKKVVFSGILTLTYNATSLILPTSANITTAAGDTAVFESLGSGNWRCNSYIRRDGTALTATSDSAKASLTGATFSGAVTFQADTTMSGSMDKWAKGADVASATALPLITDGNYFDVTGTTTVTSFNSVGVGAVVKLHFDGALTLTHHATNLILPGGANITTAAGDEAEFVEYSSGAYRCTNYSKADGTPIATSITSGTAIATTSGTTQDFTSIPSSVKKITLMFSGVSTDGTSNAMIQIGDSGGIEATGYLGTACIVQNAANPVTAAFTT
ncbi:MAG: hypothetical protein WC733_11070, partial [Methylophilus sp.]